jgi:transposase
MFFPHLAELAVDEVTDHGDYVLVTAHTPATAAACQECGMSSSRVHGHYRRLLHDLPAGGRRVLVALTVRRLACQNPACRVRTFAEPVPGLTQRHARRTMALRRLLELTGLALAGRAASRLLALLGVKVCRDTLIQLVRALPDPGTGQVTVLGVDDFAKRRGHSYATLLINMQTRKPVDVLGDREADTLAGWLREHPGIQVVCRDRAGAYSLGATDGAPEAIQVADRWHLWDNLRGYVEKTVSAHHRCIREQHAVLERAAADRASDPQQAAGQATIAHAENRPRVVKTRQRYEQVQALKAAGNSVTAVTRQLRLAPGTARRYYHAESADALVAGSLAGWPSKLDDYKPHLHQRWNEGCTNVQQLHREITALGFRGSYATVYAHLAPLRGMPAPPAVPAPPKVRHITSWIRRHPDNLGTDEQLQLKGVLAACSHLDALHHHVKAFAEMMTGRHGERLPAWIAAADADDLPHLDSFTRGIRRDQAAVTNGLTLAHSSGAVEGNVCRTKAIKRQMYGRASLDLLRKRILLSG